MNVRRRLVQAPGDPPRAADFKTWMNAYEVTFPVLADPDKAVFKTYVPSPVLPTSLVIDRAGIIRMRLQGTTDNAATEANLRAAIAEALKSGAGDEGIEAGDVTSRLGTTIAREEGCLRRRMEIRRCDDP